MGGTRILVVDDDPILREVVSSTLTIAGLSVTEAEDGADAVTKLIGAHFDLVITDLSMPRLDGFGVLKHIRANPATRNLPVIVITTHDNPEAVAQAYSAGATSFLIKPINGPMFANHVNFVLRGAQNEAELRRIKRDAEAESKRKSELLTVITHEFRTPLHLMIGFSELLKNQTMGPLGSAEYLDYASCIFDAAGRLNHVLSDISVLSDHVSDKVESEAKPMEVNKLIEKSILSNRQHAETKNIHLEHRSPNLEGVLLDCNQQMMVKALGHLIDNAIKFSSEDQSVLITAEVNDIGEMLLAVTDSGAGMHAGRVEELMEPFVQGDMTRARAAEGLGLGLSISRMIAIAHGGRLEIDSVLEQGTQAVLVVPSDRVIEALPAADTFAYG